ncbi:MAG: hypothetical protein DCF19_17455 [Pseudanabaena frigida]|uniref:Uncharacterized protein n=1 Tax=Pseudanabaena frigida TaxID=945775 RepID=A0A2W4XR56_9CYAN|nr:MAG: hypothetical protein DCF19_17455 [Pseudanabaena frigida]
MKAQQSPVKIKILQENDSQKKYLSIKEDLQFLPLQEIEKLLNREQNVILASPNQFNPSLRILDPEPLPVEKFIVMPKQSPVMTDYAVLDSMTTNFQGDDDKSGQRNQIIEPTWKWRFRDDTVISFQTGFNSFNLAKKQSIYNVPLQFGVEKKLGSVNLSVRAGIDIYDRLPTTANIEVNASVPVLNGVTLFGFFEQRPYKSNVNTLENQIKIRRFGPNIYWQIDPYTTLFSLYRWGDYNDGNTDQQSFSRLERKLGQFAIAANLFTWFYEREAQPNTYFAPRDFLVYTGEVSWQGDIFNFLNCRLAFNAGEQRGAGSFSPANSYQAKCTVKVSPSIEADLGYSYSNVRKPDTGVSSSSETISGQLRVKF